MTDDMHEEPSIHVSMNNPSSLKTEEAVREMLHILYERLNNPCVSPFVASTVIPVPHENPVCDVCGYQSPNSKSLIVSADSDGVIRCARCRANAIKKGCDNK